MFLWVNNLIYKENWVNIDKKAQEPAAFVD